MSEIRPTASRYISVYVPLMAVKPALPNARQIQDRAQLHVRAALHHLSRDRNNIQGRQCCVLAGSTMKSFRLLSLLVIATSFCRAQSTALQNEVAAPAKPSIETSTSCSIEGRVVDAQTGRALESVHVQLVSPKRGSQPHDPDGVMVFGSVSKPAGQFSIKSLTPGAYLLVVQKAGYAFVPSRDEHGATNNRIILKSGENITGFVLRMTPKAVISGRVLDEYGESMAGVFVQLLSAPAMGFGDSATTDNRGEFRLSTAPGKYYLKANSSSTSFNSQQLEEIRTDGSHETAYSDTYYPDSSSSHGASVLDLASGREVNDIDIRLIHATPRAINGVVTRRSCDTNSVSVSISYEHDSSSTSMSSVSVRDRRFRFASLRPGKYRLSAQCEEGAHQLHSQIEEGNLADSDADINLAMARGVDLSGKIEIHKSENSSEPANKRFVVLTNTGVNTPQGLNAQSVKDGSFEIHDVQPFRYVVSVRPLSGNEFIENIRVNGTPVPGNTIDLSKASEGNKLTITVNPNGAEISGRVHGVDDADLLSPLLVILKREGAPADEVERKVTGVNGSYAFAALRPGRYRILALDWASVTGKFFDMWATYATLADEIEVKEADHVSKDLKTATLK